MWDNFAWPATLGTAVLPENSSEKVSKKGVLRSSSQDGAIGKHALPPCTTTEKNYN